MQKAIHSRSLTIMLWSFLEPLGMRSFSPFYSHTGTYSSLRTVPVLSTPLTPSPGGGEKGKGGAGRERREVFSLFLLLTALSVTRTPNRFMDSDPVAGYPPDVFCVQCAMCSKKNNDDVKRRHIGTKKYRKVCWDK